MSKVHDGERNDWELIDTICAGCDLPAPVNDLGLCPSCYAKLERDLIRSRDWDYSGLAFGTADEELENLRLKDAQRARETTLQTEEPAFDDEYWDDLDDAPDAEVE